MAPCCRVFPFSELTRFLGAVNVLYAAILFEDGLDIFEQGYRSHLVPRVVLCQVSTLPIVAAGVGVIGWGVSGLYRLVVGVVLSLLVAVLDAWVLLVEIQR